MGVDYDSFQNVLKHPLRRKIVLTLETQNLSYVDLMGSVEAANTGKFNYHLKILSDLIQKDENGRYGLTEKGRLAAQWLRTFKEKNVGASPLRMADALLIGFAGFAVTLANPFLWVFMLLAAEKVESIPMLTALQTAGVVFGVFVPGVLMWRLATRRSRSHDPYDLYKAPFLAFVMLLILLAVMLVFNVSVGAQVSVQVGHTPGGTQTLPNGATTVWWCDEYRSASVSLGAFVGLGLICSFVGVAVSEFARRLKKRLE